MWSPNWEVEALDRDAAIRSDGLKLAERVREVKPVFVVADALRTFWSEAERQNDDAISTLKSLRKLGDVTWLLLHHRRKVNHQAPAAEIEEYPQGWFRKRRVLTR